MSDKSEPTPESLEKAREIVMGMTTPPPIGLAVQVQGDMAPQIYTLEGAALTVLINRIALALDEAVRDAKERCAKVAEGTHGYSINIFDEMLMADPDGPWVLNSAVAAAIREV